MIVKLLLHIMPWEIDYAHLNFLQLKRGMEYMPEELHIQFECVLNLSDYVIDWSASKLPKEFFEEKFAAIKPLMEWSEITRYETLHTDKRYGHLDMQKESYSDSVDGYIWMCPDMSFSKYLLPIMCHTARSIENEYFVLTPEIYKMWDYTWDCITNEKYMSIDYKEWDKADWSELANDSDAGANDVEMYVPKTYKFAGWFDYYSKNFVNRLLRIPEDWQGYGPWDFYCILVLQEIQRQQLPIDVRQYVLKNQIVYSYDNGNLKKTSGFSGYYKKMLSLKKIENQRQVIESKMGYYVQKWFDDYRNGRIL